MTKNITIIGSGYVGLVSGICFANLGHNVSCVDKDENKIKTLKNGHIPIFEPGLKELLDKAVRNQKISFTTNLQESLDKSEIIFIAVGTPQDEDGSADLSYVLDAAKEIAQKSNSYKLIITKSTVPVKTGQKVKELVKKTNEKLDFDIASNPEFLREGCAIEDFTNPDRVIIGVESEKAQKILTEIYEKFPKEKLVFCDIITAELIKYASNSFLATKINFINEMADLCEETGGNIKELSNAIGLDSRIGNKFLNPGPGFGGSCFPKDINALANIAKENGTELPLILSVINSNEKRIEKMANKVEKILAKNNQNLQNQKIAFFGLAFKANTDDIRYSPAIKIIKKLLDKNCQISAHDFEAIENSKRELSNYKNISLNSDIYENIKDANLIVIATEWPEYKNIDFKKAKNLVKTPVILDLRNILDEKKVAISGFKYYHIGGQIN
jgi:UDPglucose 6-dehydrogenase